ncbi:MAG: DMT family transporter [Proteobacteria bacterium]|nr:DMT family transporter [Pseudomonadota bacterium]
MHKPKLGIVLLVTAGFFLTANDAAIKWVTDSLPVGEIMFLRGSFAVLFMLVYVVAFRRTNMLRIVNYRGQTMRATAMLASVFLYVSGLQFLPLAEQVTTSFTTPFFIALLARPVLGERVGLYRWLAIATGFAGAAILLRPGSAGVHWAILLPLGAAFISALRDVITRRISATETSLAMLFFTSVFELLGGLATAPFGWVMPSIEVAGLVALATVVFLTAQFLTIEAFRNAEAAVIAPFRYALLLWGTLWGVLIWGDLPDEWTLTGAGVIVASGLFLFYRETKSGPTRP